MNKVTLIGNLTRDPEITETSSGIKICRFTLAVNRSYADANGERKVDFLNCVAWRGLAETVARYSRKGQKLGVAGSIEVRQYEDSKGEKRTATEIMVQDVEFLTPRTSEEQSAPPKSGKQQSLIPFDDDSDVPF